MTKVVYNACYGGFGLSEKAKARYKELGGDHYDKPKDDSLHVRTTPRETRRKTGTGWRL